MGIVSLYDGPWGGGLVIKSCLTLATPWTVVHQAPLCMGFSRQAYQNGLPLPSSRDLPKAGIEPRSPVLQAHSFSSEPLGKSYDGLQHGEGNGTPLHYSCLENPLDGGAQQAAVHGVMKSWTWLSDFTFTFHYYALVKEMATHSCVLAWRIPGMGSHRVGHD